MPDDSAKAELNVEDELFLRQKVEKLRRELNIMKVTNRAHEVYLVLWELLAGNRRQVLDGLAADQAVDVAAAVELRKKVVSDHINSLHMASPSPAPVVVLALPAAGNPGAPAVAGGVNAPAGMDGGEARRGSGLLGKAAATMAEENGGVQPTDAELERFVRGLVFKPAT